MSVLLVMLLLASFSFPVFAVDSHQDHDHDDYEAWLRTLTPKGTYIDEEGNEVIDYGVVPRESQQVYDDYEAWLRTLTPKGTYIDEEGNEVTDYGVVTGKTRIPSSCPTPGHVTRSTFNRRGNELWCGDWYYKCQNCNWSLTMTQITHNFVVPGQPCTRCGWDY